jgi:hypothetical protein
MAAFEVLDVQSFIELVVENRSSYTFVMPPEHADQLSDAIITVAESHAKDIAKLTGANVDCVRPK